MRRASIKKSLLLVAVVYLAGFCGLAQAKQDATQQTDPVADAARKAREEKKNAAKPKKVYTEDDISKGDASNPGVTIATATQVNATAETTAEGTPVAVSTEKAQQVDGAAPKTEDPNGEKAWRTRFREKQKQIEQAEKELSILQREDNKAQTQYYADPQKALTEQYTRKDINEKDTKIAAKKQEIAQLKQQLSEMEDQVRKAGGDPGWAR